MRRLFGVILYLMLSLFGAELVAQTSDIDQAELYYDAESYQEAIPLYKKALKRDLNCKLCVQHLALCYVKINSLKEAELWYEKLYLKGWSSETDLKSYADVLLKNHKFADARRLYQKISHENRSDFESKDRVWICDSLDIYMSNSDQFEIFLLPINSEFPDFGPMEYGVDRFVFSSGRGKQYLLDEKNRPVPITLIDLYESEIILNGKQRGFYRPELLARNSDLKFHRSASCFDPTNGRMYYTRSPFELKQEMPEMRHGNKAEIWSAERSVNGLENSLPFPHNDSASASGHPFVNADGTRLYFSSNRLGGFGGFDLYVSFWNGENWEAPNNMGPRINTLGNEFFPYLHNDGMFYFSSDGRAGHGGLDIFSAIWKDGRWSNVVPLDNPINTKSDDFGLVFDSEKGHGYFVSNREGGYGEEDIYSIIYNADRVICDKFEESIYCYEFYELSMEDMEGSTLTYEWDLGDGTRLRGEKIEYCYSLPGEYLVQLNIIDSVSGHVFITQATHTIFIEEAQHLDFEIPETAFVETVSKFDASHTALKGGEIWAYKWDFGDGKEAYGPIVEHYYTIPGSYQVKLTVVGPDDKRRSMKKGCNSRTLKVVLEK